MKRFSLPLAFALVAMSAAAQTPRFTGYMGAGFTTPVYNVGQNTDLGWNIGGGVGVNLHHNFGLNLDFTYNDNSITRSNLNMVGLPDGTHRVWGVMLDPVVHFRRSSESPFSFYLTGGGGIYGRTIEYGRQPVSGSFFTPQGVDFPAAGSLDRVIVSQTNYKGGLNIGGGVEFKGRYRAALFAEAKYHHIYTGGHATTLLPVTIGVRF